MATTFDEPVQALLDGKNFATVATVNADGSPHTSVVWFTRDGDTLLFSAVAQRRKTRNLLRDPRIALSVFDVANPYFAAHIRGTAELTENTGPDLLNELSRKYTGQDWTPRPEEGVRYVIRVIPDKVATFGG